MTGLGRRDQAEEHGGRHESRERAPDTTGQAGFGAGGARGEERCVSSRRSSFVAVLDRSLRPCGGPPAAPVFDVGTGDVPAVTRRQETYLQPVAPNRAAVLFLRRRCEDFYSLILGLESFLLST